MLFSARFTSRPLGALADNLELPATVFATVSRSLTVNWEGGAAAEIFFKKKKKIFFSSCFHQLGDYFGISIFQCSAVCACVSVVLVFCELKLEIGCHDDQFAAGLVSNQRRRGQGAHAAVERHSSNSQRRFGQRVAGR